MSAIARAQAKDFSEMMDFLEAAFKEHKIAEPRFERLLPDLYQPTDASMGNLLYLRDEASGRIASSVGLFPMRLKLWGQALTVQGVGGVGTLPEFRGKGAMNELLGGINEELQKRGGPFSWLSGMRRRYGVWGYEKAGSALLACLAKRNAKGVQGSGFEVSETPAAALPWEEILTARELGPATGGNARLEELKLKASRPRLRFFIAKKTGSFAYAALADDNGNIADWAGAPEGLLDIVLKILETREELQLRLPLDGSGVFKLFEPLAEDHSLIMQGNFAVVSLSECLGLACRNPGAAELPAKGRRSLGVVMKAGPNPEQSATLSIDNGEVSCKEGLEGASTVLALTPQECAALLFGPLKPSQRLGDEAPSWLDLLLPLPVLIPRLYWV